MILPHLPADKTQAVQVLKQDNTALNSLQTLINKADKGKISAFVQMLENGRAAFYGDFSSESMDYFQFVVSKIESRKPTLYELKTLMARLEETETKFSRLGKLPEPDTLIALLMSIRSETVPRKLKAQELLDSLAESNMPKLAEPETKYSRQSLACIMQFQQWHDIPPKIQMDILSQTSPKDYDNDKDIKQYLRAYWLHRLTDRQKAIVNNAKTTGAKMLIVQMICLARRRYNCIGSI